MKQLLLLVLVLTAALVPLSLSAPRSQEPNDYAAISQRPTISERRAYFSTLSPQRKSALWRKHFAVAVIEHPELTEAQLRVVALAAALASADTFRDRPNICGKDGPFAKALTEAFQGNDGLRAEIFGRLGGPVLSARKLAHAQDPVGGGGSGGGVPECGCNNESLCDACWPSGCQMWPCRRTSADGCGCFWLLPCNQLCG